MNKKIMLVSKPLLMLFCFFICNLTSSFAQQLNSEQIKELYIYNFIKHISWPNENKKLNYIIGVYGNDAFAFQ